MDVGNTRSVRGVNSSREGSNIRDFNNNMDFMDVNGCKNNSSTRENWGRRQQQYPRKG
jgi:hypothetical protein